MEDETIYRVLVYDKDIEWFNLFKVHLEDEGIEVFLENGDFLRCDELCAENPFDVVVINVHSLEHPIQEISHFRSSWPRLHLLFVYEKTFKKFDNYLSTSFEYMHKAGQKKFLLLDDLLQAVRSFTKKKGSGNIRVIIDDKVTKAFKNITRSQYGEMKYGSKKIAVPILRKEVSDIIREMFYDLDANYQIADNVRVSLFGGNEGKSGSVLLKLTPTILIDAQRHKSAVLKFGSIEDIEIESKNYDKFVEWFLTIDQTVRKIAYKKSHNTAGLLYSYPKDNQQDFVPFADHIRDSPRKYNLDVVKKMFNPENKHWLSIDGDRILPLGDRRIREHYFKYVLHCDLYDLIERHFGALKDEISNIQRNNEKNVWKRSDSSITFKRLNLSIPHPMKFVEKPLTHLIKTSVVHGDLHTYNILVNDKAEYYFLDFYYTGYGHIYRDFIELELSIRYDLFASTKLPSEFQIIANRKGEINYDGLTQLIDLERAIIGKTIFNKDPKMPQLDKDSPKYNENIFKAYSLICEIRRFAELNYSEMNPEYFIGFIYNSLKALKYFYHVDVKIYRLLIAGLHIAALKNF